MGVVGDTPMSPSIKKFFCYFLFTKKDFLFAYFAFASF